MTEFNKKAFQTDWADWKLRTLLLDHYIYWQGERIGKDKKKIDGLKRFLTHHSTAKTGGNVEFMLDFYGDRSGVFLKPDEPSSDSGFINPAAKNDVDKILYSEYNLRHNIHVGYTIGDLLWNVYNDYDEEHHSHHGSIHMARSIKSLFSNVLKEGMTFSLAASDEDTNEEEDYLKLTWKTGSNHYVWWLGFSAGGFLKKEDPSAQGLVRGSAFQIQQFQPEEQYAEQFWVLCAPDFGNKAIHTAKGLNGPLGAGITYNLITAISLVKFFTWIENQIENGLEISKILKNFVFFFRDQDCPISVSKGIRQFEDALAKG